MALLLLTSFSFGKMFDAGKFSKKLVGKNLDRVVKTIKKSSYTKKLPTLKLNKALSPKVLTVVRVANKIAKKGDFEDRLITKTLHPTDLIRQYSKYGDKYLDTMKYFSKKSMDLSKGNLKKLKNNFPNMPNIKFKTSNEFNNKFIVALRQTGKKGWEVSTRLLRLSSKYPRSTVVTGLMAWYAVDPNGFMEKKEQLLAYAEETLKSTVKDVTRVTLGASSGIVDGLIETIKEKATLSNILGLIVAFFLFILWKLRSYIKRYFKIKLEQGLKNTSKKNSHTYYEDEDEEEGTF